MGIVASDYYNELAALLPAGPAWDLNSSSTLALFLDAWSQELARIQTRANNLISEADPRINNELLSDYERIFGLPTDCMVGVSQTLQQRHNGLVSQITSVGGQSPAYFINLALNAGFTITITEFSPARVTSTVASPIYDASWAYAWQVNAQLNTVTNFLVNSLVADVLSTWGNNLLECLINRYKPAHTTVLFSYT